MNFTHKEFYKNKKLNEYGLKHPINKGDKMTEEYKEAISGEVVKLENEGDFIEGKLLSFVPSTMYPKSFAIKVETKDGLKTVFTSKIVTDLIASNSIVAGMEVKIVYTGTEKTKDGAREYKNYKVFWK